MITKDLWTCPRKESTNHSMVWEELKKFRARLGFSLERKNYESKEHVNPRRLALSKERWNHLKELREELRSRASWSHKRKTKIVTSKAQEVWDWNEIKFPEGTRREGPHFPSISVQNPHKSMAKIPSPREERERGCTGWVVPALFWHRGKEPEREGGWGGI